VAKTVNEDSVALEQVVTARGRVIMAVVCDGSSGTAQGEVASGYAAEEAVKWFYIKGIKLIDRKSWRGRIGKSLTGLLIHIRREMIKYGQRKGVEMGVAVTIALLWRRHYQIVYMGKGHSFLCKRRLRMLSIHHGAPAWWTKWWITVRHQGTRIIRGRLARNEGLLLCTDGFCDSIDPERMAEVLYPRSIKTEVQIEARLRTIAEYDMKQGETDNISAVYLKVM
jgi:serine/threonine protein phosphatase PrpC